MLGFHGPVGSWPQVQAPTWSCWPITTRPAPNAAVAMAAGREPEAGGVRSKKCNGGGSGGVGAQRTLILHPIQDSVENDLSPEVIGYLRLRGN